MSIKYQINDAKNGFVLVQLSEYGTTVGEPEIYTSYVDLIERISNGFGQNRFAETIKQSQEMASAMAAFCQNALAPSLKAIEVKLNPGLQNVVPGDKKQDEDFLL